VQKASEASHQTPLEATKKDCKDAITRLEVELRTITQSNVDAQQKLNDCIVDLEARLKQKNTDYDLLSASLAEAERVSCDAKEKLDEIRAAISSHEVTKADEMRQQEQAKEHQAGTEMLEAAEKRVAALTVELAKARAIADEAEDLRASMQRNSRKLSKAVSEKDSVLETNVQLEIDLAAVRSQLAEAIAQKEAVDTEKSRLTAELAGHGERRYLCRRNSCDFLARRLSTDLPPLPPLLLLPPLPVNNRQKIQYAQQLKMEVEQLQSTVRDKQAAIQQLKTQNESLHLMLKKQTTASKELEVSDCIKDVVSRKASAKRGLAGGKENSLLSLTQGAGLDL